MWDLENKSLDIFWLKIYRCIDTHIIFPFNSGFTLTQGTKDATNAIYSLVIEPIDPLPSPRSEWIHRIQRASLKISMAMAGALGWKRLLQMKRLFSQSWPAQELSDSVLLCKGRKLDQRKPRNHTNTQILIQSSIESGKLTHRSGSTEQKLCQTDFSAVAASLQKTSGQSNDKNKIQRKFLLFEANLHPPFFTLIIKSKFKEEKKSLHLIPCNLQLVMTSFFRPEMAWWEFFNARVAFALRTLWSVRENQLNHFQALKWRCPTRY